MIDFLVDGFQNLIDGWSELWTNLPGFWSLFSRWLPADIVAAMSLLIIVLLALACWRIFN